MKEESEIAAGREMLSLVTRLFPICRSITGDGVRETLGVLREEVPLEIREIPSGTEVFDWEVPLEWNIFEAWIKNSRGERVVDFAANNLHVMGYSVPVRATMTLAELREHLFTLPEQPDLIPYRTSYYKEAWGFCMSQRDFEALEDGEYEVYIDSTLEPGNLTYGEYYLPGRTEDEILISCHVCHPSLANDNLSGIALAVQLAKHLLDEDRRYSYRFLFVPGTIGSITWLAGNEDRVKRIKHGLVLTCVGDPGAVTYKKSRRGDAEVDRAMQHVLKTSGASHEIVDFSPYGYDERQYCSPGFNLAVGCVMRSQHGTFPEYHTNADNPAFLLPESLGDSLARTWEGIGILEGNGSYLNLNPKCEPRLGKRGLYSGIGGMRQGGFDEMSLLWVLNLSDGQHDLLSIAERAGMKFSTIRAAADALSGVGLLEESNGDGKDE